MRTQRLADGVSKAEISQLGDQHYRAKIVARGSVLATLETNGHDDGLDANDMFVTLTMDGQVHSWMGGGHQGPGTFKLAGGWTAKVTKAGELRYRAQIIGHDGVAATLETKGHDVGLNANGIYIVLSAGDVISAATCSAPTRHCLSGCAVAPPRREGSVRVALTPSWELSPKVTPPSAVPRMALALLPPWSSSFLQPQLA
nr:hypothetical protein [Streptomyces caniferus]